MQNAEKTQVSEYIKKQHPEIYKRIAEHLEFEIENDVDLHESTYNLNDTAYWKQSKLLLKKLNELDKNENLSIDETLKIKIKEKLIGAFTDKNQLLARIIIYAKVDTENLLNFYFYNNPPSAMSPNLKMHSPTFHSPSKKTMDSTWRKLQ